MGSVSGCHPKNIRNIPMFLDSHDGYMKELSIPFHLAITDENSKSAKDLHLLRRLKACLKTASNDNQTEFNDELISICQSFETPEMRLECIELLMQSGKISPAKLKEIIKMFLDGNNESLNNESDFEFKNVDCILVNYIHLLDFYLFAVSGEFNTCNDDETIEDDANEDACNRKLNISISELENIQKVLDLTEFERKQPLGNKVTFQIETKSNNISEYISAFDCSKDIGPILKHDREELFANVGAIFYSNFVERYRSLKGFIIHARCCKLSPKELLTLLLEYWLGKLFNYAKSEELIDDLTHFMAMLICVCRLASDLAIYEYGELSGWWQQIREKLLRSDCVLRSLLVAIVARNVAYPYLRKDVS